MRRSNVLPTLMAILGLLVFSPWTLAQFTINSSTQSLTSSENVTLSGSSAVPPITNNNSTTAGGVYNNSETSAQNYTYLLPTQTGITIPEVTYVTNGTASQNSLVGSSALSGSGSASASANWTGNAADIPGARASASSNYDVIFQVPAAVAVNLTGNVQASTVLPPVGYAGSTDQTIITLSGNDSTLYEVVAAGTSFASQPVSFSATLSPGVSYELSAFSSATETETPEGPGDITLPAFSTGYNFSLAVPEPASVGILAGAFALALRRKQRAW